MNKSSMCYIYIQKKWDENIASLLVDANLLHLRNKNLEHSHNCLERKLLFPGLDLKKKQNYKKVKILLKNLLPHEEWRLSQADILENH